MPPSSQSPAAKEFCFMARGSERPRSLLVSLGGCHPDPRLGPILGPSRSHPGSEVVPSRFAMCFVLQCFGPIQFPRWGPSRPVLVPSCSRALLTGSGLDGQKQTSWPLPSGISRGFFVKFLAATCLEMKDENWRSFSPNVCRIFRPSQAKHFAKISLSRLFGIIFAGMLDGRHSRKTYSTQTRLCKFGLAGLNQGCQDGAFGKWSFGLGDTRHFRHLRRFPESELQIPLSLCG